MNYRHRSRQRGFTLIEILVVIGMIAILATVVLIAINPARQFAQGRNSQRVSNVNALLNAVGQNVADNKGVFTCASGSLPVGSSSVARICKGSGPGCTGATVDLSCLAPTYISSLPFDPKPVSGTAYWTNGSDYDTGYEIYQETASNGGRVSVLAPAAELGQTVSVTR